MEIGGAARTLCLTLGALAEIETVLQADGLEALALRLSRLSAADLDVVLRALLRGGGEAALADDPGALAVSPKAAGRGVAEAFRLAFA